MEEVGVTSSIFLLMIMYAVLLFVIVKYTAFLYFESGEELLDVTTILEIFHTMAKRVTLL